MPASYAISVRRAGVLPAASFRFRVTPDTLAVRLTVPTIRVRRGLAPPSHKSATTADLMALTRHAPCRAHQKKRPGFSRPLPYLNVSPPTILRRNSLLRSTFERIFFPVDPHHHPFPVGKGNPFLFHP